jgi:hypothetical protein
MQAALGNQIRAALDAFDISIFSETIKNQPVAAAHIQNIQTISRPEMPPNYTDHGFLTSAPPPMTLVKIAILLAVLCFHLSS